MLRMKSLPRVAIVGAGITGCTIAWKIRQALGFDVDLYERRDDILLETTAGTSNRFHYGYQYALSDETAKTLRDYHQPFKAVYGQCVLQAPITMGSPPTASFPPCTTSTSAPAAIYPFIWKGLMGFLPTT